MKLSCCIPLSVDEIQRITRPAIANAELSALLGNRFVKDPRKGGYCERRVAKLAESGISTN